MHISLKFKPQDVWVGAYWENRHQGGCDFHDLPEQRTLDVWVCLIPMLPVKLHFGPDAGRKRE